MGVISPLLKHLGAAAGVLSPVWATKYKAGTDTLEQAQQRGTKMIGTGMLLMLGCVSSAFRRPRRKLIAVASAELTRTRFSIVHRERMRDFGHNFQHVTFQTPVMKKSF